MVLETIHHYAAATSLLLEEGLVDHVIFTMYDHGYPLDETAFSEFADHTVFFGGGYDRRCLAHSISEMRKIRKDGGRIFNGGDLWAIPELVLNGPWIGAKTVRARYTVEGISDNRIIPLENLIKRLKLKPKQTG